MMAALTTRYITTKRISSSGALLRFFPTSWDYKEENGIHYLSFRSNNEANVFSFTSSLDPSKLDHGGFRCDDSTFEPDSYLILHLTEAPNILTLTRYTIDKINNDEPIQGAITYLTCCSY